MSISRNERGFIAEDFALGWEAFTAFRKDRWRWANCEAFAAAPTSLCVTMAEWTSAEFATSTMIPICTRTFRALLRLIDYRQ